jgi:predicted kinase
LTSAAKREEALTGERAASAWTATSGGLSFKGLWLIAKEQKRYSRVSALTADASDARVDVALAQATWISARSVIRSRCPLTRH